MKSDFNLKKWFIQHTVKKNLDKAQQPNIYCQFFRKLFKDKIFLINI